MFGLSGGFSAPFSAPDSARRLRSRLSILILCEESFRKHDETTYLAKARKRPKRKHVLNGFYMQCLEDQEGVVGAGMDGGIGVGTGVGITVGIGLGVSVAVGSGVGIAIGKGVSVGVGSGTGVGAGIGIGGNVCKDVGTVFVFCFSHRRSQCDNYSDELRVCTGRREINHIAP